MNIYLTAIVKSKEGSSDAMKPLLQQLVVESRKENACLQYDLHQDQENRNVFIFHEIWESQEGRTLHDSQPHIARFIADSADFIDGTVQIYQTDKIS
ncbi:Quinol monooxygenase YgiN [Pedobacter steynii]|uniref:Quinol monooxygenase YgiN n=1 Tax=Pedobacter steynii TaxID=430522 RepID=A0A1G9PHS4_9SPHI|nr:putative quinol monooxygenase [Pedobacter steynii]NQX38980.1 antibiotic biosynthesis monooxygenase [Pedobacter steynii]SDL98330.1 Quinol monooxygenase YgiN [Pedobacter steynii]